MILRLKNARGVQGDTFGVLLAGRIIKTCGNSTVKWNFLLLTDYGQDFGPDSVHGCRVYLSSTDEMVYIHSFLKKSEREKWYDVSVGDPVTLDCGCSFSKCNIEDVPAKEYSAHYSGHMIDER